MDGWFEGFEAREYQVNASRVFARIGGRRGAPALVLLHGFPQTHAIWHRVAPLLAPHFELVLPDLRGYGDSAKPPGEPGHANYSKRAMALDIAALMASLGHQRYFVCGHDRGARVAHRLALDHADAVRGLVLLDIAPTLDMYERTEMRFATWYYHWFFLIQPAPRPERMIGADPVTWLREKLSGAGPALPAFFDPRALAEYERCFSRPEAIHGACEDYRAAASIDLEHDRASRAAGERLRWDTTVLWGAHGIIGRLYDPVALWQAQSAGRVAGRALDAGHYLPEQRPDEVAAAILQGFATAGPA